MDRDSRLHRADARLKFILTVAFILTLSLLPAGSFFALGIAWLTLMATAIFLARIHPRRVIRASFVAAPFVFAAFPLIFTKDGEPLGAIDLRLFSLTVSREGLTLFATILLKSWISVQAAVLLTFTTTFHDLVDGLRELRLPRLMVSIIALMYRYLGVLTDEATRMLRARAARSAEGAGRSGGSVRWRAKVVGGMVGALFIRSYERSERVYAAMQSRGFDGQYHYLKTRGLRPTEWAALAFPIAAMLCFELGAHLWFPRV
ncbi:MAG TPA: cobalt ECF transporter T component CbiQ [Tepidiformaceae bacterium]|nr:cobalt ECF transporter T component CbiQ [Tepidiformaceae bacterium]